MSAPDYGCSIDWDALEERLAPLGAMPTHLRIPILERMVWAGEIPVAAYSALPIKESQAELRERSAVEYTFHPSMDVLYDHPFEDYFYSTLNYLAGLPKVCLPRRARSLRCAIPSQPRPLPEWLYSRDSGFRAASVCLLNLAAKPLLHGKDCDLYRLLRFVVRALAPECAWQDLLRYWSGGPDQDWTEFFLPMESADSLESHLLSIFAKGIQKI